VQAQPSDLASIEYMRSLGARISWGDESPRRARGRVPVLISDTGFVMISDVPQTDSGETNRAFCLAASEITSSGIRTSAAQAAQPAHALT